jgi:hypothetical protein
MVKCLQLVSASADPIQMFKRYACIVLSSDFVVVVLIYFLPHVVVCLKNHLVYEVQKMVVVVVVVD